MSAPNRDAIPDTIPDAPIARRDTGARRIRLREFQAQLVERMQAVRSGTQQHLSLLGMMIGGRRWLLDLREAGEIVTVGEITSVPLTHAWFLGLTNIRGNLVGVADFAHFQGMDPTPIDKESRIVVFSPSLSCNCGLLVSRVMGLRNGTELELQTTADPAEAWSARRFLDREGELWTELKLSLVARDARFLDVGA
jgi:twitching motility protein PilI